MMITKTDFEIAKMKMLKTVGKAVMAFSEATGYNDFNVDVVMSESEVMTSDGTLHPGANISFRVNIMEDFDEFDDDDDFSS